MIGRLGHRFGRDENLQSVVEPTRESPGMNDLKRPNGPLSNRQRYFAGPLNLDGRGLEIGPSYNPTISKTLGPRVDILDHASQSDLIAKYQAMGGVDITAIEPVDFVSDGRRMTEVIGERGVYDWIIASHVIEHTPDLLGFLLDCQDLLNDDGILALAVPDKRTCFDVFSPLSSVGHVLDANHEKRTRPTPGAVFDHAANSAYRQESGTWTLDNNGALRHVNGLATAFADWTRAKSSAEYIDAHVWRFVPSSFRLMVRDLNELGMLGLKEFIFHPNAGAEFYMFLSKSADGCPHDRTTLAKEALKEHAEIIVS